MNCPAGVGQPESSSHGVRLPEVQAGLQATATGRAEAMTTLSYRSFVQVDDLAINECTIRRATDGWSRWWQLWCSVPHASDGHAELLGVAVIVNGS